MNFSAIVLAGGASSRMGRDKSFIEINGQMLLTRQIQNARSAGVAEIFIAGRMDVDYSRFNCPMLPDRFPNAGPLAGIESGLAQMTHHLLLVLAVDLPAMNPDFLRTLIERCDSECGVVSRVSGQVEPLVAIYPKAAWPLAASFLKRDLRVAKQFAHDCEAAGFVRWFDVAASENNLFANCNYPNELPTDR